MEEGETKIREKREIIEMIVDKIIDGMNTTDIETKMVKVLEIAIETVLKKVDETATGIVLKIVDETTTGIVHKITDETTTGIVHKITDEVTIEIVPRIADKIVTVRIVINLSISKQLLRHTESAEF